MSSPSSYTLDVPGATLYYEVRGSGPVLMLVGHPMGASGFTAIAPLLAEQYTVVTYDPRGFARSTIADAGQDAEPDLLADDVRRVLEAVGEGPAHVFGSSGGAVTGLALVVRYPGHVGTLVAHEPPLTLLLPEAEEIRAGMHGVYETYRSRGIGAAWESFASVTGMGLLPQNGRVEPPSPSAGAVATSDRFFGHGLLPIALYEPDITELRAAAARVVVAAGTASRGELAQRTAFALAERLGTPMAEFPGGHAGFVSDAEEFAVLLRRLLAELPHRT